MMAMKLGIRAELRAYVLIAHKIAACTKINFITNNRLKFNIICVLLNDCKMFYFLFENIIYYIYTLLIFSI
jgi:hypothetical protein